MKRYAVVLALVLALNHFGLTLGMLAALAIGSWGYWWLVGKVRA